MTTEVILTTLSKLKLTALPGSPVFGRFTGFRLCLKPWTPDITKVEALGSAVSVISGEPPNILEA